jgi:hypothetical protein
LLQRAFVNGQIRVSIHHNSTKTEGFEDCLIEAKRIAVERFVNEPYLVHDTAVEIDAEASSILI